MKADFITVARWESPHKSLQFMVFHYNYVYHRFDVDYVNLFRTNFDKFGKIPNSTAVNYTIMC